MGTVRRAGRFLLRVAGVLAVLVLALVIFLTQTPRGREWVLRQVLSRVERGVDGTITVENISSPGLLRGFTFHGVRLTGPMDRPFLVADSILAGISPRTILAGDLVFTRVEVWSPRVVLERLPDQERLNVVAIFRPDRSAARGGAQEAVAPEEEGQVSSDTLSEVDTAEASSRAVVPPRDEDSQRVIALRDVRIHDGSLDILLPLPAGAVPSPETLTRQAPSGQGLMRRYGFRAIELDLPEADIRSPGMEGERFQVQSLSFLGEVRRTPFRVEDVRGQIRRLPGRLLASVEEIRLPDSRAQGRVEVAWGGEGGVRVTVEGETGGLNLRDLRWIEPRLAEGIARGPFVLEMQDGDLRLGFRDTEVGFSPGRARARGSLVLLPALSMKNLEIHTEGVDLHVLDPWFPDSVPMEGKITGDITINGNLEALTLGTDVSLFQADTTRRTDIRADGIFHLGDTLGVTDFTATLAPLEWGTFSSLSPYMSLRGPGALRLEASGSLATGMELSGEATHVPAGQSPSRVTVTGLIRKDPEDLYLDLDGEFGPVSFTTLRRDYPNLPVTGEVEGPVSVWGYLSALTIDGRFTTASGPLGLQVSFDARNPTERYRVDARGEEFLLSGIIPSLPDPTRLTGRLLASGGGVEPDSLEGEATVFLRRGQIGGLRVDTAALVARVDSGLLTVDALMAETGVGRVQGGGAFGIASSSPDGELTLRFESESLEALRPFILGETPVVLDELTSMERNWLVMGGASLDTIPTAADVALDGSARGQATFRGGLRDFSGEGSISFQNLRFRADYVESGSLTFEGDGLPGDAGRIQGHLRTDSLLVRGQSFQEGELEVDVSRHDGNVRVGLAREGNEEYRARGTFVLDTLGGGQVNLDEMFLRFDSVRWNLGGPTSFAWNSRGIEVRDFRLIRPGVGGMRIQVDGFLPLRGEGEMAMEVEGLHLDRLARIGEIDTPIEGVVGGNLRMTGTAESPRIEGRLAGTNLRYGSLTFDGATAEFSYGDLEMAGEVRLLETGGREVLVMNGTVPADLRFQEGFPGIPDAPVSLDVQVDSFPAVIPLAVVEAMEQVEGTVSGQFHIGGTPLDLEPTGELHLRDGAAFFPALGVRYHGAGARFVLNPDARVDVDGMARNRGAAQVSGSITLDPVTDPVLDLTIQAQDFLAVSRRDVEARITGEVQVTESYRRPRVEGSLTVNQGVLMVEELARSAEVVDLSDPAFMDFLEQEETLQPVVQANRNPFLQNLMLDVEVGMSRGSWLRGKDLNVEMSGDVQVFWDRTERDLALVGGLQAVRGVYTVLGRQFQVAEGTVSFQGTPGINPNLDIQARHTLNTQEGTRLEITASVEGTLLNPRVSLSSNAAVPIAESDLVSYLIFGRPSYALATAQAARATSAARSLLGAAGGAGANFALGTISSQLGSVVARDFGLDFLAISQGENADPFGGLSSTVATTQVEIGQYITDDVFAALLWRPLTDLASTEKRSPFAGFRIEWRMADLWTLEGFIEDRFARSPLFSTTNLAGLGQEKIPGFFFWREWGY